MDHFFKSNRVFAVAGATTNPSKFGNKVLKWYTDRNIPVVPINFRKEQILGLQSVEDVTQVPVPKGQDLAISIVTPPAVTKELLENLGKAQGPVGTLWFQPDTFNEEILQLARDKVSNVIAHECILVKGDRYLPSKL